MEFVRIKDVNHPLTRVIKDDPVRPHIPIEQRVNEYSEIMALTDADRVLAVTCMSWLGDIPTSEQDLLAWPKQQSIAVFYTIWSYSPGAGAELLRLASQKLLAEYPDQIRGIVTLSPPTEVARRFHLRNGAHEYRRNTDTVNYGYYLKDSYGGMAITDPQ
jgi:hypothetical protein